MSTTMERMLLIQDRDRRVAQLEREASDIPARKQQVEARLAGHKEALAKAQDDLKKNAAATKQVEVEVESRQQRIARLREQQFQIKSNEEYKALEHEVSVVEKEVSDLEDQELVLMEEADRLRALIAERQRDLKLEEKRVVEEQKALDERHGRIEGEIHDVRVDRQALATDVDPAWLARYERIFSKTGDFAIVRIENGCCGGCHMTLPAHVIHEAKRHLTLVECSYCSRILYWQP